MTDFDEYVARYSRYLSKFCIKLCGDLDDADDLFQDTWMRALQHFDAYDPDKSFQTWLFTICINIFRNTQKRKSHTSHRRFSSTEEKERFLNTIAQDEQDIDERLDLHRALSSLPAKYREVLSLYYLREFKGREIAAILGVPEGTVNSRLHHAKKLLKRRLEDESNLR